MNNDMNNETMRVIPAEDPAPRKKGFPLARAALLCFLALVVATIGFFATAPADLTFSERRSIGWNYSEVENVKRLEKAIESGEEFEFEEYGERIENLQSAVESSELNEEEATSVVIVPKAP